MAETAVHGTAGAGAGAGGGSTPPDGGGDVGRRSGLRVGRGGDVVLRAVDPGRCAPPGAVVLGEAGHRVDADAAGSAVGWGAVASRGQVLHRAGHRPAGAGPTARRRIAVGGRGRGVRGGRVGLAHGVGHNSKCTGSLRGNGRQSPAAGPRPRAGPRRRRRRRWPGPARAGSSRAVPPDRDWRPERPTGAVAPRGCGIPTRRGSPHPAAAGPAAPLPASPAPAVPPRHRARGAATDATADAEAGPTAPSTTTSTSECWPATPSRCSAESAEPLRRASDAASPSSPAAAARLAASAAVWARAEPTASDPNRARPSMTMPASRRGHHHPRQCLTEIVPIPCMRSASDLLSPRRTGATRSLGGEDREGKALGPGGGG